MSEQIKGYLDANGLAYLWLKIKELVGGKVDKVDGKGLSSNDYTDTYKSKLDGITQSADSVSFTSSLNTGKKIGTITINDTSTDIYCDQGSDSKVNVILSETTKAYILGTSTEPTETATGVTAISDTGVYLDSSAGKLVATSFSGNGSSLTDLNASSISSGTIDAARLPQASSTSNGAMSSSDKAKLDSFRDAADYALKDDLSSLYKYKGSANTIADLPEQNNVVGDVYNVKSSGMNYAWDGEDWDALGQTFEITAISNTEIDDIIEDRTTEQTEGD